MNDNTLAELKLGIINEVPENGLVKKLKEAEEEKRPLIVKFGCDPTAPDLHLGHAVPLRKLRQFQNAGHDIYLLIGDFTARIGDPTGRNSMRPPLSPEQIKENAETYVAQVGKILDLNKTHIVYNSEWLEKMNFMDVIKLLAKATLAQMLQRNDFRERYEKAVPIALHEIVYPIMQGYDSVILKADIELGGTDQLFNCMVGKDLQNAYGQKSTQIVLSVPILRGTDGVEKMSKSKGNYIGLTEAPNDMYGKTMSIPDELLQEYIELATDFPFAEKQQMIADIPDKPMEIKKKIAFNIVKTYHSEELAKEADNFFYTQVQGKDLANKEYEEVSLTKLGIDRDTADIVTLCQALQQGQSKGGVRRLIEGGGIAIDGEKIAKIDLLLKDLPDIFKIKIGKRSFFKVGN